MSGRAGTPDRCLHEFYGIRLLTGMLTIPLTGVINKITEWNKISESTCDFCLTFSMCSDLYSQKLPSSNGTEWEVVLFRYN